MPVSKEKQKELEKQAEKEVDVEKLVQDLPGLITSAVNESMKALLASAKPKGKDDAEDEEEETDEEDADPLKGVDVEKMSKGELAKLITANVSKQVDKQLKKLTKGVDQELTATKTVLTKEQLTREIKDVRSKHPDFDEFKDTIGELAKKHKSLGLEELYHLARSQNPDKVKELDTKAAEKEAEKAEAAKKKFGGLTPTSYSETKSKGTMTQKEASEAAWDESMADVPASVLGGGND